MKTANRTIDYYNRNANQYFQNTVIVNMKTCCDKFIKYIVPGGKIIDIGAGSGRDAKYFKNNGFKVEAIDASEKMCQLATKYAEVDVQCERIQDWKPKCSYDGIWASASLLHLSLDEIIAFICRVPSYLNTNGMLYFSMKKGIQTGYDSNGRFFTSFSEESVNDILDISKAYEIIELWITEDKMNREEIQWLNILLRKR